VKPTAATLRRTVREFGHIGPQRRELLLWLISIRLMLFSGNSRCRRPFGIGKVYAKLKFADHFTS
jgi:hypothetical protein